MVASLNKQTSGTPFLAKQTRRDDLLREYVAGTSQMAGIGPRNLSQTSDDVLLEVDDRTYEQMMRDPKVSGSVLLLVASVVADGYQLTPSITSIRKDLSAGEQKDLDTAQYWKDFCDRSMSGLPKPFKQTAGEMLRDALKYGNKVAVTTYRDGSSEDKGKLVFASIKPKPRKSFRFVVDEFMNLYGIEPTLSYSAGSYSGLSRISDLSKIVWLDRLAVLTVNGQDGDPRGSSHIRAAYNAWNLKCNVWPEFLRWLINEAIPGIIIILSENEQKEQKVNDGGTPVTNDDGSPVMMTAAEVAVARGEQFRNGFVAAFPFGTKIEKTDGTSDGSSFSNAIHLLDGQITEAILFQAAATNERVAGTRSESEQKMTVLDLLIFSLKSVLEDMHYGVLKNLVRLNGGDEAAERFTPKVSWGTSERRNFAADLVAYAKAYKDGFLQDDQLPEIYAELGLKQSEMLIQRIAQGMKESEERASGVNQQTDEQEERGKAKGRAA